MVWSLTKRLFELTEQLAEKEIEQDPKGFIIRETFSNKRNSMNHGNQLIPERRDQLFQEEFKYSDNFKDLQLVKQITSNDYYDDEEAGFVDAVEDLYQNMFVPSSEHNSHNKLDQINLSDALDENGEPIMRKQLPWFKDPNAKISIWAVIKDSLGKDLS